MFFFLDGSEGVQHQKRAFKLSLSSSQSAGRSARKKIMPMVSQTSQFQIILSYHAKYVVSPNGISTDADSALANDALKALAVYDDCAASSASNPLLLDRL